VESLEPLLELCKAKFGKAAPSFSKLRSELLDIQATISMLLQRKLEKEPDPVEVEIADASDNKEGESAPNGSSNGSSTDNTSAGNVTGLEPNSSAEAVLRIAAAARYLRKSQPASPVSYLMLRALRWGELRAQNTEVKNFVLAAPPTELRTRIRSLALAGQWSDLLEQAETAMGGECGRGWLDLQRYSVTACEKLGHVAVARAIKSELKSLLTDFPALAKATLSDDTGAANPETMVWLAEQVQK
jgi:type VI secretion system protein ImpA